MLSIFFLNYIKNHFFLKYLFKMNFYKECSYGHSDGDCLAFGFCLRMDREKFTELYIKSRYSDHKCQNDPRCRDDQDSECYIEYISIGSTQLEEDNSYPNPCEWFNNKYENLTLCIKADEDLIYIFDNKNTIFYNYNLNKKSRKIPFCEQKNRCDVCNYNDLVISVDDGEELKIGDKPDQNLINFKNKYFTNEKVYKLFTKI